MNAETHLMLYTDATELGGAELFLGNLAAELPSAYRLSVVGTTRHVVGHVLSRRPGAQGLVVPAVRSKRDPRAFRAHLAAVRSLRPDICQLNLRDPYTCRYAFLTGRATPGVRMVAVEHLPIPTDSIRQRLVKHADSRLLDAHIAVGERAARQVEEYARLRPGSVVAIPNGIPDVPVTAVHRLASGPVIGSVGRLHPQKGFDILLRAAAQLEGVTVVVVGDGPGRAELLGLAESEGMGDRLVLVGWQDDVRAYLAGFDLFVLPSRFEGLPLSIIEAMLTGLPVVATDVGSVAEAVRPETGVLVRPEDPEALRDALARLLADGGLRSRLGARGRDLAQERFTASAMARAYQDVYEEVLG